MQAEIICIGDEILIGQIVNTNSVWLAENLNQIGIQVVQITTIADIPSQIESALDFASSRADLVIITGGLGPTKDDYTKQTLCKYFNSKLIFNEEVLKDIERLFTNREIKVSETNLKQAEVPDNCKVLRNSSGTAPGMWFEKNNKIFISLPGVPFEMKTIMLEHAFDAIKQYFKPQAIVHKTILTQGIGESFLSDLISDWENNLPSHLKLAYLPSPGIVKLRLSAYNGDEDILRKDIEIQIKLLKEVIEEYIYGFDNDTLEEIIGKLLSENNSTLAIAESCTGGFVSHKITSISGCSKYFKGSIISYSNEVKEKELRVNPSDLAKYGAVSEQVVKQMATSIREKFDTDYAISTSGIAGPDGGTKDKPVGTIWIGIATRKGVYAHKYNLGENRERNIQRATITALNLLRKEILKNT